MYTILFLQEGETPVHYAAGIQKAQAHDEFEDTDIMKLLLEYNGDTGSHTKMVIHDTLDSSSTYNACTWLFENFGSLDILPVRITRSAVIYTFLSFGTIKCNVVYSKI